MKVLINTECPYSIFCHKKFAVTIFDAANPDLLFVLPEKPISKVSG
jgi:hypothetical protein